MTMNLQTIDTIRRAAQAVADLREAAQPQGTLCHLDRKRVGQVLRTTKWLLNAIGHLVHDAPELLAVLPELSVAPPMTDEELDAAIEAKGDRP